MERPFTIAAPADRTEWGSRVVGLPPIAHNILTQLKRSYLRKRLRSLRLARRSTSGWRSPASTIKAITVPLDEATFWIC